MDKGKIAAVIDEDLKKALKNKDRLRIDTLRMLKNDLRNREIEMGEELGREKEIEVISSYSRRCRESISEFRKGGRDDLLQRAEDELKVVMEYLPEQMGREEMEEEIRKAIADTGATSPRDLGRVMGAIMGRFKGKVDGSEVREIALDILEE